MKNTQTKKVDIPALTERMKNAGITLRDVQEETAKRKTKKGKGGYSYHKIRRTLTIRDQVQMSIVGVALSLVEKAETEREEMLRQAEELQLTAAQRF